MIKINKCIKSLGFAIQGILRFFKDENNARVHLLASVLVISFSLYLKISAGEWLWVLLCIALVWITEAINTAIEKIVDFISPEFNPKAGEIKDLAAGAVLFAAIFAFISALIIFLPKFF
jgi:diacylglycerol kinase